MSKITVWTKQNSAIMDALLKTGRHVAKKEYVHKNEDAMSMITAYDWLVKEHPDRSNKPSDADYPIWISTRKDAVMKETTGTVFLELEIEEELITYLNVDKWGMINNFSYIPLNKEDEKIHKEKMKAYGISDVKACMSRFYPELKKEIQDSWKRVFNEDVKTGNDHAYGLIWEIKKEWVKACDY